MEGGLLLDAVVSESAAVLKLLTSKDQPLLIRGDSLLVLDLPLDVLDRVAGLHLQSDVLAREGLHKDLHDVNSVPKKNLTIYQSSGFLCSILCDFCVQIPICDENSPSLQISRRKYHS